MKSKLLLSIVAVASAIFVPMAASRPGRSRAPAQGSYGPDYKYQAYVGWGYTSLNQVNQSRSGLQGVSASVMRSFGDHFGVKVDGGHYAWTSRRPTPAIPTVDMFLVGPVIRGNLFEKWSAYAEGLVGGVHTGGVVIEPNVSFAGGFGLGVDYNRSARWSLRLFGDDIGSSFTLVPFQSGYSPHMRWNARAGIGLVYHF